MAIGPARSIAGRGFAPGGRSFTALVTARLIVPGSGRTNEQSVDRETDNDHGSPFPDAAARRSCSARLVYPRPAGELLARELLSWDEFGHRLGGNRMIMRLVEHVLWTPAAGPSTPPR